MKCEHCERLLSDMHKTGICELCTKKTGDGDRIIKSVNLFIQYEKGDPDFSYHKDALCSELCKIIEDELKKDRRKNPIKNIDLYLNGEKSCSFSKDEYYSEYQKIIALMAEI